MIVDLHKLWNGYELIDCGGGKKLERFGEVVLIRPEVTAENPSKLSYDSWKNMANAEFFETSKNSGIWKTYKSVPETWTLAYETQNLNIVAELALTNSKHIGIFPEQVINWIFIEKEHSKFEKECFLNLFGYTGLSTVAASHFFYKATHIDSIKKVVEWTRRNAQHSERNNIRFIVEDASKFVDREIKRGNKYDGIILDPPAIGSGANNEKWIFSEMIEGFLANVNQILKPKSMVIMNLYTQSYNKDIKELVSKSFPTHTISMCEQVRGLATSGNTISHGWFVWLE